MMLKFLLLIVLTFLALGVAAVLMRRMMSISERIADLQSEMKKSQVRLDAQKQMLEKQKEVASGIVENQTTENLQRNDVEEKNG